MHVMQRAAISRQLVTDILVKYKVIRKSTAADPANL